LQNELGELEKQFWINQQKLKEITHRRVKELRNSSKTNWRMEALKIYPRLCELDQNLG
jgi:hypothetical protein